MAMGRVRAVEVARMVVVVVVRALSVAGGRVGVGAGEGGVVGGLT